MAAEKGSAFLLKIGDGADPVQYSTVAGLRTTQMSINGDAINVTTKESGGWRELLSGAGVRSVSVSAAGIFLGSEAEIRMRGNSMEGRLDDYELSFESGERMQGKFLVARLDYSGDFNGERTYTVTLESSGPVGIYIDGQVSPPRKYMPEIQKTKARKYGFDNRFRYRPPRASAAPCRSGAKGSFP